MHHKLDLIIERAKLTPHAACKMTPAFLIDCQTNGKPIIIISGNYLFYKISLKLTF